MTEYEMISYLWNLLGSFPTSRGDYMDEETYWAINNYLYGDEEEVGDDEDEEG